MSGPSGTATIGLQVVLNDVASVGLAALGISLIGVTKAVSGLNALLVESGPMLATVGATAIASGALFGIFAGALGYSIEQGMGLQDALVTVENSVQGADQNVQGITQDIITLGNTSIYSSQQIADGFAAMGKYGQTAADIVHYTGAEMIILAEAINTDTVPAGQLLSNVMQMFNINASQSASVVQALTFGFYNGQGNVASFSDALTQVGPIAHQLGISLNDVVIYLDILAQDGLKGAEAGTALRYALSGIVTPTQQAIVQLANLGIVTVNKVTPGLQSMINGLEQAGGVAGKEASRYNGTIANLQAIYAWAQKLGQVPLNETFYQWALSTGQISDKLYNAKGQFIGLSNAINMIGNAIAKLPESQKIAVLQQIFSTQGGTGMLQLVNNLQKTNDQYSRLLGILEKTSPVKDAERVVHALSGQLKALGTSIQDAAGTIGMEIIPIITQLVGGINFLVGVFAKAPGPIHQFAAIFLIVGTALSGLTFILAGAVLAFAFLAGAAGGAVLTIGAAMGILMGAIMLVAGVIILLKSHWQQVQQVMAPVGQALGTIGNTIKSQLLPALAPLLPVLKIIGIVLGVIIVGAIIVLIATLAGLISFFAKVLAGVVLFVTGVIKVFSGLVQIVTSIVGGFLAILGDMFHGQWSKIGTDASNMWNGIVKGLGTIWNGFKLEVFGIVTALVGGVIGYFQSFGGTLVAFVGSLAGKVATGALNLASQFMEPIKQLPHLAASTGQQIIQGILNSIQNGSGMLGNAMRGLANNMINSLKGVLGISSPSKVMMELGQHTATGFLQGITGTNVAGPAAAHLSGVVAATRSAVSGGISSAARGAGAAGGGGNTTLQFMIDSTNVATVVMNNLTQQLQMNGAARKTGNSK
jgi:TP901 family phage tail tape measure protein